MKRDGKVGCGCLIFILICVLVAVGLSVHPLSLKLLGNQFRYEDKVVPAEALFVPRFDEDKHGELYVEAFREYWAGNGRIIYVEEDKMFGASILDPVNRMARLRDIKEAAIKKIDVEGEGVVEAQKIMKQFAAVGCKRVIILVPEYASRRYHMLYGDAGKEGKTTFLIKPVTVAYFKKDKWWKDSQSRLLLLGEIFSLGPLWMEKFKYGGSKG
jgi:hypothetical protein